jgi:hypothetical protein
MCTRWYSGKLPAAQPACQPAQRDTSPQASRASSSSSTSTSLIPSASLTLSSPQRLHHHRRCPNALTAAQLHNGLPQGHAPCRPQCVPPPYRRCSLLSPGHRRRLPQAKPQITCANPPLQSSHTPSRPRTSRMATCRVCRLLALCMQRPPTDTCAGTMASTLPMAAVRITFPPAPNQLG